MAVPDTFRIILVALAAMVVYRFVTDLTTSETEHSGATPRDVHKDAVSVGAVPDSPAPMEGDDVSDAIGHGTEAAPAPETREAGGSNKVLIEYCTS
mmetsp:Transcript_75915/g.210743  ORF Transcript_75915/g.210743 Transcript_75915/m.210743 type:complete len:96 (-) Transcript_75915:821-1108(-)